MSDKDMTIENLEDKLDSLDQELDTLVARFDMIPDDAKLVYAERLAALHSRRETLKALLAQIELAGKDNLDKLVNQFYVAREALDAGIQEFKTDNIDHVGR